TRYAMVGCIANTAAIAIALAGAVRAAPLIIWCAYSYGTALFLIYRHVRNRKRWPHSFQRAARRRRSMRSFWPCHGAAWLFCTWVAVTRRSWPYSFQGAARSRRSMRSFWPCHGDAWRFCTAVVVTRRRDLFGRAGNRHGSMRYCSVVGDSICSIQLHVGGVATQCSEVLSCWPEGLLAAWHVGPQLLGLFGCAYRKDQS